MTIDVLCKQNRLTRHYIVHYSQEMCEYDGTAVFVSTAGDELVRSEIVEDQNNIVL